MRDEVAIQQTINIYSEASSRRDIETVVMTFTEDGSWELPDFKLAFQGRAVLREVMPGVVAPYAYFVQINAPAVITVDGDKATARSVIRECAKLHGKDEATEILGFYNDELVRTAEGWKFSRRVFVVAGAHSFAVGPAQFGVSPAEA